MWEQYGPGGDVQISQHLCLLAANVATEKVFIFLWFWWALHCTALHCLEVHLI